MAKAKYFTEQERALIWIGSGRYGLNGAEIAKILDRSPEGVRKQLRAMVNGSEQLDFASIVEAFAAGPHLDRIKAAAAVDPS